MTLPRGPAPRRGRSCPGIFDAAVVGGGPAGAVTALELARAGRRVLLLDRGRGDGRGAVERLPSPADALLRRLGIAEALRSLPHLRCAGLRSAWGSAAPAAEDDLLAPHGHGLRFHRADAERLLLSMAEDAGAVVHRRACLGVVRQAASGWTLTWIGETEPGRAAFARYLIDASGQERVFLRRHGVAVEGHDRLAAQVATFDATAGTDDEDARSWIEAEADGWWATARLPGRRRVAVLVTDAEPDDRAAAPDRGDFLARLARTRFVGARVLGNGYALAGDPHTRPIDVSRPRRLAGERWLAVGDAAGSLDAVASLGMTAALAAGEQAARAVDRGLDGDPAPRDAYVRDAARRFADHLARRRRIYARERRWAERPFWARRLAAPLTAAPPAPSTPGSARSSSGRAASP